MILALPCVLVVITPACEPVNDRACAPSESMAIATSALEIRSPAVSSMSSSRAGGAGHTCLARSSRSSVVSPMAETTTTTSLPAFLVSTIRSATRRIRSASDTEEPPYFCTTSATICPFTPEFGLTKDKGDRHMVCPSLDWGDGQCPGPPQRIHLCAHPPRHRRTLEPPGFRPRSRAFRRGPHRPAGGGPVGGHLGWQT